VEKLQEYQGRIRKTDQDDAGIFKEIDSSSTKSRGGEKKLGKIDDLGRKVMKSSFIQNVRIAAARAKNAGRHPEGSP